MRRSIAVAALLLALSLTACDRQGQNRYNEADVGVAKVIQFGHVVSARQVEITGKNTGTGMLIGAGAGAGAGSYAGGGSGQAWSTAGGALAGAVVGALAERAIQNHDGMEYIVTIDHGRTLSIVQNIVEGDVIFKPGDRVMVQQCEAGEYYKKCVEGGYQRVLPAGDMPEKTHEAKHVPVVD